MLGFTSLYFGSLGRHAPIVKVKETSITVTASHTRMHFVRGATSDDSTRNSGTGVEGISVEGNDNYKDWETLRDKHKNKTFDYLLDN